MMVRFLPVLIQVGCCKHDSDFSILSLFKIGIIICTKNVFTLPFCGSYEIFNQSIITSLPSTLWEARKPT